MNKSEFIDKLSKELDISKAEAGRHLNKVFKCISTSLKDKDELRFVGFGTFKAKQTKAKVSKNTKRNYGKSASTEKGKFLCRK